MGVMIDGKWHTQSIAELADGGSFKRNETSFRNWVTVDGEFPAQAGRYHLYVSLACPWAHRTLIMRMLKGLEDKISVSVVNSFMGDDGWSFDKGDGVVPDPFFAASHLRDVYASAKPDYTGRVTVPVLLDTKTEQIVSNESAEIIRMFNSAFDSVGAEPGDYYPAALRDEIDKVNARVYSTLNNGVYKSGFARTQKAYERAVLPLFDTLDWMEDILSRQRWLAGDQFTEADIRAFVTLIRFDPVYHGHFKCNRARIVDYPNLWAYTRDIYQRPGVAETVDLGHIRNHYYASHETVNPTRIVAVGPVLDYMAPHGRG
ncbi:MAG: glutathione S-transferase family protein [Anderseniella sp.]|nr:glutathione S-transferase family protein [Anderseniella sp.]